MTIFNNILINFSLFCLGLLGICLNRQNVLLILICVEILLLSINLNFAFFGVFLDDAMGFIKMLFILTVASAEAAIGLGLLILFFKQYRNINIYQINKLCL